MDFANPHFENPERLWFLAIGLMVTLILIANGARARRYYGHGCNYPRNPTRARFGASTSQRWTR